MSRPRNGLSPTLFPFLAVLVCTLGTLILLLALVTRRAAETARARASEEAVAESASAIELEDARWRREQMLAVREEQAAALEERRSALAHLEDHGRRLRRQLQQLRERLDADDADASPGDQLAEEIAALEKQIAAREAELGSEEDAAGDRPPRVAILPHRGPNGTSRQPVYLECVADGVILQPEGVRIPTDALRLARGPDNPLDAALRAVRQHHERITNEPPYPLVVVRPEGVLSYAVARTAMAGWDDRFGYELIPGDLELEYPPAQQELRAAVEDAIAESLARQRQRLAAMPSHYRTRGGRSDPLDAAFAAARADADTRQRHPPGDAPSGASGNAHTPGAKSPQGGSGARQETGGPLALNGGTAALDNPLGQWRSETGAAVSARPGSHAAASSGGANDLSTSPAGAPGAALAESPSGGAVEAGGASEAGGTSNAGGAANASGTPNVGGAPNVGGVGDATAAAMAQSSASPGARPGSAHGPGSAAEDGSSHGAGGAAAAPADGSAAGTSSADRPPSGAPGQPAAAPPRPLADTRGSDWAMSGLRDRGGSLVVRHLALRCEADRFLLTAAKPGAAPQAFAHDADRPSAAVVALAEEVRRRVQGWGPALTGGQWQPVLRVDVAPGGGGRFDELERMLDGSGIQVQRSESR